MIRICCQTFLDTVCIDRYPKYQQRVENNHFCLKKKKVKPKYFLIIMNFKHSKTYIRLKIKTLLYVLVNNYR